MLFSLPMFMTMEMWWLGFYMDRLRLALLLVATFPLLVGLSHYIGFEETFGWLDDLVDALVAYAVGFAASLAILLLLGIIELSMSADEIVGKVAVQAVPGSIGAMLARNLLGEQQNEAEQDDGQEEEAGDASAGSHASSHGGYGRELFLIVVGALYLALNVAPTEEMILIAYRFSDLQAIGLAVATLVGMHAFVYAVGFRGQENESPSEGGVFRRFVAFTLPGYAIALLISLYILWTFGRTDGTGLASILTTTLVLGLPSALGAAAARLIL